MIAINVMTKKLWQVTRARKRRARTRSAGRVCHLQTADRHPRVNLLTTFYTYEYLRSDWTPYYVGKGCHGRAYSSQNRWLPVPKDRARIRIQYWADETEAFEMEKFYIRLYGRKDNGTGILRNMTDGGEGVTGWNPSEETRRKMSEASRNRSEETRRNLGLATKKRFATDPRAHARHSANQKISLNRPEVKARSAAATAAMWTDPEVAARILAGQHASWTPERRARQSAAAKRRYEDPKARAVLSAAAKNRKK